MTAEHDNEMLFQPLRVGAIELPQRADVRQGGLLRLAEVLDDRPSRR